MTKKFALVKDKKRRFVHDCIVLRVGLAVWYDILARNYFHSDARTIIYLKPIECLRHIFAFLTTCLKFQNIFQSFIINHNICRTLSNKFYKQKQIFSKKNNNRLIVKTFTVQLCSLPNHPRCIITRYFYFPVNWNIKLQKPHFKYVFLKLLLHCSGAPMYFCTAMAALMYKNNFKLIIENQ